MPEKEPKREEKSQLTLLWVSIYFYLYLHVYLPLVRTKQQFDYLTKVSPEAHQEATLQSLRTITDFYAVLDSNSLEIAKTLRLRKEQLAALYTTLNAIANGRLRVSENKKTMHDQLDEPTLSVFLVAKDGDAQVTASVETIGLWGFGYLLSRELLYNALFFSMAGKKGEEVFSSVNFLFSPEKIISMHQSSNVSLHNYGGLKGVYDNGKRLVFDKESTDIIGGKIITTKQFYFIAQMELNQKTYFVYGCNEEFHSQQQRLSESTAIERSWGQI